MMYAVIFEDNPGKSRMRALHMSSHLSFLEARSDLILSAGPLTAADENQPRGGLWIVKAPRMEDVESLVEEDPFYETGLRSAVHIYQWKQVFAEGRRLIHA